MLLAEGRGVWASHASQRPQLQAIDEDEPPGCSGGSGCIDRTLPVLQAVSAELSSGSSSSREKAETGGSGEDGGGIAHGCSSSSSGENNKEPDDASGSSGLANSVSGAASHLSGHLPLTSQQQHLPTVDVQSGVTHTAQCTQAGVGSVSSSSSKMIGSHTDNTGDGTAAGGGSSTAACICIDGGGGDAVAVGRVVVVDSNENDADDEEEERAVGAVSWTVWTTYAHSAGAGLVVLVLVSLLAMQVRNSRWALSFHSLTQLSIHHHIMLVSPTQPYPHPLPHPPTPLPSHTHKGYPQRR